MRPPQFWQMGAAPPLSWLWSPLEALTARLTARRVARHGWTAPVPVLCCGNATMGGAGKTTVAIDLGQALRRRGIAAHFLTRGYGGRVRGVTRVSAAASASEVGDEALLLAAVAPTWVAADRAAAAHAAVTAGAELLIMDDGLQNPGLTKTASLLVIDGATGFGNGRLFPAGPLREPVAAAADRCIAALLIGEDRAAAAASLPSGLAVLHADLVPGPRSRALSGRHVLAFAGIAHPEKFYATLEQSGAVIVARRSFADHHPYRRAEIETLLHEAAASGLTAVTTAKDAVRLPGQDRERVYVADVGLCWKQPGQIEALMASVLK